MADKILISTLFLSLTYSSLIPRNIVKSYLIFCFSHFDSLSVPLTALIIARDIGLIGAGFYVRFVSLTPPVSICYSISVS